MKRTSVADDELETSLLGDSSIELESDGSDRPGSMDDLSETDHRTRRLWSGEAIEAAKKIPFFYLILLWVVGVSLILGTGIWAAERANGVPFLDSLFVAVNGVTATGLASVDLSRLTPLSKTLVAVGIQLGSSTMISLVPVLVRLKSLWPIINDTGVHTFNLAKFKSIPQWLVEYKALVILVRLVLVYQLVVYLFYGTLIALYLSLEPEAHAIMQKGADNSVVWSAFHVVSAYNNAGFSLMPDSFISLVAHPFLLVMVCMVCLHGNVLLPVFLRWIVIFLSYRSPKNSSRKVYFRYLLLNGRYVYTNLFASQQNWILFITQVFLIAWQMLATLWVSWGSEVLAELTPGQKICSAFFLSVNTRHAGITVTDLSQLPAAALITFLLMVCVDVTYPLLMFLAPAPFAVVLRSSMNVERAKHNRGRFATICEVKEVDGSTFSQPHPDYNDPAFWDSMVGPVDRNDENNGWRPTGYEESTRLLNVNMAMKSQIVASADSAGPVEMTETEMDYMTDTRTLLLMNFPGQRVSWKDRVLFRARAVNYHLRRLLRDARSGTVQRDMTILWLGWFLITAFHPGDLSVAMQFGIIFELVSAYGNVGLTLGSKTVENAALAADVFAVGKCIIMMVEIFGKTRSIPLNVDSVLHIKAPPRAEDILNDLESIRAANEAASVRTSRAGRASGASGANNLSNRQSRAGVTSRSEADPLVLNE